MGRGKRRGMGEKREKSHLEFRGFHGFGAGNGIPTGGSLSLLVGRGISQTREGNIPKKGMGTSLTRERNISKQGEKYPEKGSRISQNEERNIPK